MLSSSDFDLQMLMLQLMPQLFAKKFLQLIMSTGETLKALGGSELHDSAV